MRIKESDVYVAVASNAGAVTHPAWYRNIVAHPEVSLQDGATVHRLRAREVHGEEKTRWWKVAERYWPHFPNTAQRPATGHPGMLLEPTRRRVNRCPPPRIPRPMAEIGSPATARRGERTLLPRRDTIGRDRPDHRTGGVAKASLYNTFGSKEELVRAYLESRHARTTERLTAAVDEYTDPVQRLLAVFEAQGRMFAQPDFRGCAFISACRGSAGRPGRASRRRLPRRHPRTVHPTRARCGRRRPGMLGHQLHLIYDGAGISARMDRDPLPRSPHTPPLQPCSTPRLVQ
jgi:deazaflavin-dependent oxidoreductase (nitroreductase family)